MLHVSIKFYTNEPREGWTGINLSSLGEIPTTETTSPILKKFGV